MDENNRILDFISKEEILTQLAEESSELAQAALKLRRARTGINPTTVNEDDAWDNLTEEFGDILNCIEAFF